MTIHIHPFKSKNVIRIFSSHGSDTPAPVHARGQDSGHRKSCPLKLSNAQDQATRIQIGTASKALLGVSYLSFSEEMPLLIDIRLKDNANAIAAACKEDLGKGNYEANLTELDFCTNTIIYDCNNLEKWAKDESAPDIPLANQLLWPKVRKDPMGTVLIIGFVR